MITSLQTATGSLACLLATAQRPPISPLPWNFPCALEEQGLQPRGVLLASTFNSSTQASGQTFNHWSKLIPLELDFVACFRVTSSGKAQVLSWTAPTVCHLLTARHLLSPSSRSPVHLAPPLPRPPTKAPRLGQYHTAVSWQEQHGFCLKVIFCVCVVKLKHVVCPWHDFCWSRFNTEQAGNPPKCVILLVFLILV